MSFVLSATFNLSTEDLLECSSEFSGEESVHKGVDSRVAVAKPGNITA